MSGAHSKTKPAIKRINLTLPQARSAAIEELIEQMRHITLEERLCVERRFEPVCAIIVHIWNNILGSPVYAWYVDKRGTSTLPPRCIIYRRGQAT